MNQFDSLVNLTYEQPQEIDNKIEGNRLAQKYKKAARRAKQLIGKNKGRWLLQERRQYYVFLRIYSQFFITKDHRRNDKVFRMMANFVKTRTPDQCRTHHQKLQFKYYKVSKIIQVLKEQFGRIDYQQIVKKCQTTSTHVCTPTPINQRDATFNECQNTLFIVNQQKQVSDLAQKQVSIEISQKSSIENIQANLGIIPSFTSLLD